MAAMKQAKVAVVGAGVSEILKVLQAFEYDEDGDEECSYIDGATQREFQVRRITRGDGSLKFYLTEAIPYRHLLVYQGEVLVGTRDEPRLAEFEKDPGPNGFVAACLEAGIDRSLVPFTIAGFSVDSRYLGSLEACAEAIYSALSTNQWYSSFRELDADEKASLAHQARVESSKYWAEQEALAAAAESHSAGLFKGAYDMMGRPLGEDVRKAILAYINAPSQEQWLEVRNYLVAGSTTLWQAWAAVDSAAPQMDDIGFPSADTARTAIRRAVEQNKQRIRDKIAKHGRPGLRSC